MHANREGKRKCRTCVYGRNTKRRRDNPLTPEQHARKMQLQRERRSNERQCREIVARRSGGLCERCCRGGQTTMHHRKKRSQGGKWTPDNIVALCGHGTVGCHSWVEHNPNAAAEQGWHVRPWENPAEVLVLYRGSTWSYLDNEGNVNAHISKDSENRSTPK